MSNTEPLPPGRVISGKAVVVAIFVFAGICVLILQVYWNRHIEPFMGLQEALAERFADEEGKSSPRVEGGQRKMSKNTPRILRVTMRVPFDPEDESNAAAVANRIQAVAEVALREINLREDYDILTTHFYHPIPGGVVRKKKFETPVTDLQAGPNESQSKDQ